jgi:group I intron endonuclease
MCLIKNAFKELWYTVYQKVHMDHIIYKITNTENKKIYIGQTKKFYGKTKYGINRRLKTHIKNSEKINKTNGCPKLENAIRKYGKEKFKTEQLEDCSSDDVDDRETYYIELYDSTNRNIGYNIASGGKGRKVVYVEEEARINISKGLGKDGDINIKPYKDKKTGEIIGYRARRREHERYAEKFFTSKKFTLKENYQKAKEFIDAVKNKEEDKYVKYNKTTGLPKNISCVLDEKDKAKIIGHQVNITHNKKMIHKSFQSDTTSLEDLLKEAIDFIDCVKNDKEIKCINRAKKSDLPTNIRYIRNEKNKDEIIGYSVVITHNKKTMKKEFRFKNSTSNEVLKKATEYRDNYLKELKDTK